MNTAKKKAFIGSLVEGHIDSEVYDEVVKLHARQSISIPKFGNVGLSSVDKSVIARVEFTETELSPFRSHEFDCKADISSLFRRQASCAQFIDKKIPLSLIREFLVHAFSPDQTGHRPYPSAGGLYPVEPIVFLFEDRVDSDGEPVVSGCYHYRSVSKCLQFIQAIDEAFFLDEMLHGLIEGKSAPGFAILYVAHVGKSIFKYRHRGYRHAMMEAGSMYQHATVVSQKMELRTTLWSSFSEPLVLAACGLNQSLYLASTMQLFGYGEK